jgi:hypothetical protein
VIHALEILFKISRSAHKKAVVEARGQRPSRQTPEHHLRSLTRRSQHFSLRRDTPAHTLPIMTQSTSTLYSSSSPGDTERVLARLGHLPDASDAMPQTNTDIAPVHLHVNKIPEKYYEFQYLFASQVTSLISGRCWSEDIRSGFLWTWVWLLQLDNVAQHASVIIKR